MMPTRLDEDEALQAELLKALAPSTKAALLRIANKVTQGFYGEIQINVARNGGVRSVRWIQTETGDQVRELV